MMHDLHSRNHLIVLGMANQGRNREARRILVQRGETSGAEFLRQYEGCLSAQVRSAESHKYTNKPKPPTPSGECCDCGNKTDRRWNKMWQCQPCAVGAQEFGHIEWRRRGCSRIAYPKAAQDDVSEGKAA
jgi:hypothetical protein